MKDTTTDQHYKEEEELETEVCYEDTCHSTLEQNIAFLIAFNKKAKQMPVAQSSPQVTDMHKSEDKSLPPEDKSSSSVTSTEITEPGQEATVTVSETDVTKKPSDSDTLFVHM